MLSLRAASAATLAILVLSPAAPGRADDALDPAWRSVGITAGALALQRVLARTWKTKECELCDVNGFDLRVANDVRWSDPRQAQHVSTLLANVAIPTLAGLDAWRATSSWGDAGRDVLVVAEAASLAGLATTLAKDEFARLRPGLAASGQAPAAYHSMWSGHTSLAFSVAVSQAMQDTLRGDPAAPWVWAVGLTLASGVGYLRVAGGAHWPSDVLAGAAAGTAFGIAVPLLERRLVHGITLAPAPGGIALRW